MKKLLVVIGVLTMFTLGLAILGNKDKTATSETSTEKVAETFHATGQVGITLE